MDEIIWQEYGNLFKLEIKNKEVFARNSGGMERNIYPVFCMKDNMSLLKMTLICISCWVWGILTFSLGLPGLVNPFSSHLIKSYCHHELWSYFESNVSKFQSRVADMFKRSPTYKFKPLIPCLNFFASILNHSFQLCKILCFVSMTWDTLWPSFDESLPVDSNSLSRKMI